MHILFMSRGEDKIIIDWDLTKNFLPAPLSFTRASSALKTNQTGLLENVATDIPRFDYDPVTHVPLGLLIESQSTNILLSSNEYLTLKGVTGINNFSASPDGATNSIQLLETDNYERHINYIGANSQINENGISSVYIKSINRRYCGLRSEFTEYKTAVFDLDNISITYVSDASWGATNVGIEDAGNGWRRIWAKQSSGMFLDYFCFFLSNSGTPTDWINGIPAYTGDSTKGVLAYGQMYEISTLPIPSSLINTTGSLAMRAQDALSFTIPTGVTQITYTFDDNSTQAVEVSAGAYTVPTNLNRPHIKRITSTG